MMLLQEMLDARHWVPVRRRDLAWLAVFPDPAAGLRDQRASAQFPLASSSRRTTSPSLGAVSIAWRMEHSYWSHSLRLLAQGSSSRDIAAKRPA